MSCWALRQGFDNLNLAAQDEFRRGEDVLNDPFLRKNSCLQLALLSDETYQAGLEKIKAAIAREEKITFRNELHIKMFTGFKPGANL